MIPDAFAFVTRRKYIDAVLLMIISVFLWAAIEIIGGLIPGPYSAYQTVWIRYGTHLLFMLTILGPRYKTRLFFTRRPVRQWLRSLLMLGMPIFFIMGVSKLPLKDVLAVFWVSPLLVMGLSIFLLGETIRPTHWLATWLGLGGVLMMLRPNLGILTWQVVLPLGMAFCFGLYLVMTRQMRTEDTLASLFYTAAGVFILLSFGLPLFWQPLAIKSGLMMALIGLIGFLVLFTLDKSLELAPASIVAPFTYTQPIWLAGLTYLLTGQLPGKLAALGIVVIVGSALYLLKDLPVPA